VLLKPPAADDIEVTTLQGFCDLFVAKIENLDPAAVLIHVESPESVVLIAAKSDQFGRRQKFIQATYGHKISGFAFGQYMPSEQFIIGLQSQFRPSEDIEYVQRIASNLKAELVGTSNDDGISQSATMRAGVVLKAEEKIQSRVSLMPFRTFVEADQPKSDFIFRLKSAQAGVPPQCALFEADGGRWRIDAMANIAFFLREKIQNVPIIT